MLIRREAIKDLPSARSLDLQSFDAMASEQPRLGLPPSAMGPNFSSTWRRGTVSQPLDILRLFAVDVGQTIACSNLSMDQLVKLGMYGLSVPVLGALNEQRHAPRCKHRKCMPTEGLAVEDKPEKPISCDHQERQWMRS